MKRKVDPEVVDGVFGEELRKFDQASKVNTGLNALAALLLWIVAYGVLALVTLPFYALGDIIASVVLWGAFLALIASCWLVWGWTQQARKLNTAIYGGDADAANEAPDEDGEGDRPAGIDAAKKALLLPPYLTVQAIDTWRKRNEWTDVEREDAVAVLVGLLQMPAWVALVGWDCPVPAERRGPVMQRLEDMDLLRRRGSDGRFEVRANPLFRKACGVSATPGGDVDEAVAGGAGGTAALLSESHPDPDGQVPAFEIGAGVDPLKTSRERQQEERSGGADVIDVDVDLDLKD